MSHPAFAVSKLGNGIGIIVSSVSEGFCWDVVWVAMVGAIGVECRGGSIWRSVSLTNIWVHLLHIGDRVDALSVSPFSF